MCFCASFNFVVKISNLIGYEMIFYILHFFSSILAFSFCKLVELFFAHSCTLHDSLQSSLQATLFLFFNVITHCLSNQSLFFPFLHFFLSHLRCLDYCSFSSFPFGFNAIFWVPFFIHRQLSF